MMLNPCFTWVFGLFLIFAYNLKLKVNLSNILTKIGLLALISTLPGVSATPECAPFPDITFRVFNEFVKENFSSRVTLSTILLILFSLTNNTDLLSLHARQDHPLYPGEKKTPATAWIQALSRAIQEKLDQNSPYLHKKSEEKGSADTTTLLSHKLDGMAKLLDLHPINSKGRFTGNLKSISYEEISPAMLICPVSAICETNTCLRRALYVSTIDRDIPRATLIKETKILKNVQILTGICKSCKTLYSADRERIINADKTYTRIYLNSAKYLKLGQSLWADRTFSNSVLSGMYSFHASASAYTEFWNHSFGNAEKLPILTRRHAWQAFIQESVRTLASAKNQHLEVQDGLSIDDLTKQAFSILGDAGIIRSADQHECSECTHKFKSQADIIGQGANTMQPEIEEEHAPVRMVVLDGIVMGPTVSCVIS